MARRSMLAHGSAGRRYGTGQPPEKFKKIRKGQRVIYTGAEQPDERFEGKKGTVIEQAHGSRGRSVIVVLDDMGKYQMNKNVLETIEESINGETLRITKRQLRSIIQEIFEPPTSEEDAAYDQGMQDGFESNPQDTAAGSGYYAGYESGAAAAEDPESEAAKEYEEKFGRIGEHLMRITKRQLRRIIREEKQKFLKETVDMPYTVYSPMSSEPARFRDLEAAIATASAWERDGFLQRKKTHPDVIAALDLAAGRNPGGSIG